MNFEVREAGYSSRVSTSLRWIGIESNGMINDTDGAIAIIDIGLTPTRGLVYHRPRKGQLMLERWIGSHKIGDRENVRMGIQVIFASGEIGDVTGDTLDHLIRENEVVAFRRLEGWVQISCDTTRRTQQPSMRSGNRHGDLVS
jgi:hypothetical protein